MTRIQLVIHHWDETIQTWIPLITTIDSTNQQVSAQTTQPGYFDLQGPLVCPADLSEPNDNYNSSSVVQTDGTLVNSLFDIAQDEDWFQFDAVAGRKYTIDTKNFLLGVDTAIEIYSSDGITLFASDDNSGGEKASSLIWQAPRSDVYFVRVKQATESLYGCNATYSLRIKMIPISFYDVATTHAYYTDIEILYANGLTGGCTTSPLKFCPDQTMNRGQAAVFTLRGNYGNTFVPDPATHIFKDDWTKGIWAEPWAEAMRNKGLSAGCLRLPTEILPLGPDPA